MRYKVARGVYDGGDERASVTVTAPGVVSIRTV